MVIHKYTLAETGKLIHISTHDIPSRCTALLNDSLVVVNSNISIYKIDGMVETNKIPMVYDGYCYITCGDGIIYLISLEGYFEYYNIKISERFSIHTGYIVYDLKMIGKRVCILGRREDNMEVGVYKPDLQLDYIISVHQTSYLLIPYNGDILVLAEKKIYYFQGCILKKTVSTGDIFPCYHVDDNIILLCALKGKLYKLNNTNLEEYNWIGPTKAFLVYKGGYVLTLGDGCNNNVYRIEENKFILTDKITVIFPIKEMIRKNGDIIFNTGKSMGKLVEKQPLELIREIKAEKIIKVRIINNKLIIRENKNIDINNIDDDDIVTVGYDILEYGNKLAYLKDNLIEIYSNKNIIQSLKINYSDYTSDGSKLVLWYNNRVMVFNDETRKEYKFEYMIFNLRIKNNILYVQTGSGVIRVFDIIKEKFIWIQVFKDTVQCMEVCEDKLIVGTDFEVFIFGEDVPISKPIKNIRSLIYYKSLVLIVGDGCYIMNLEGKIRDIPLVIEGGVCLGKLNGKDVLVKYNLERIEIYKISWSMRREWDMIDINWNGNEKKDKWVISPGSLFNRQTKEYLYDQRIQSNSYIVNDFLLIPFSDSFIIYQIGKFHLLKKHKIWLPSRMVTCKFNGKNIFIGTLRDSVRIYDLEWKLVAAEFGFRWVVSMELWRDGVVLGDRFGNVCGVDSNGELFMSIWVGDIVKKFEIEDDAKISYYTVCGGIGVITPEDIQYYKINPFGCTFIKKNKFNSK
ncbi:Pre-mRNA-splicing factor RSE1 [Astathelohania contejeani]|uniref:Pre-mRNA-splicing factor RSE1 n=1 Tax=Astathelohania contejeani TaxID=164912 RepID=A0ABQ7HZW1_9MICR|nr:Pre-mRNA-splicing factor RSE1 [Thelohania contejeani]